MTTLANGMTIKIGQIGQMGLNIRSNTQQQYQVFDFEDYISKLLPELEGVDDENKGFNATDPFAAPVRIDPKRRTVVCKHWLMGLCYLGGKDCTYLHRLDQSKSPACQHGMDCKKKICHLKHVSLEDISECIFYKQGFCYNGAKCQRRHIKRTPDECPGDDEKFESAAQAGAMQNPQSNKKIKSSQRNENYKVSLCEHWLKGLACIHGDTCHFAHGEEDINEASLQSNDLINDINVYDPTRNALDMDNELSLPWPVSAKVSYFLCQAPNLRSLKISKERGVWSVPTRYAAEMNSAFRATQHVVIFFCVRSMKGLYGVAKMLSPIPPLPSNPPPVTPEFQVQWIRTMRVSMRTVAQLKTGNTQMFIGRTPTDCWFSSQTGNIIMMICFRKPQWDWTKNILKAQGGQDPPEDIPSTPDALFSESWIEKVSTLSMMDRRQGPTGVVAAPGSAGIGKDWYSLDLPGFVFTEFGQLKEEMLYRNLFGLPGEMKEQAQIIHPGAPLFLLDTMQNLMYGIFMSSSAASENFDPNAFVDPHIYQMTGNIISCRPIQVRVEVTLEAQPISVFDNDFKMIFPQGPKLCGLDLRETKMLSNLFAIRAGVLPPTTNITGLLNAANGPVQATQYKALSYVNIVPIDIQGPLPEVKRLLLGNNGSTVKDLITEITGGNTRLVRCRMRGINSGFNEGPLKQELQEPLHFNVSAETEEMLERAMSAVQNLVEKVRIEVQRLISYKKG